jgi:hypothetical protein
MANDPRQDMREGRFSVTNLKGNLMQAVNMNVYTQPSLDNIDAVRTVFGENYQSGVGKGINKDLQDATKLKRPQISNILKVLQSNGEIAKTGERTIGPNGGRPQENYIAIPGHIKTPKQQVSNTTTLSVPAVVQQPAQTVSAKYNKFAELRKIADDFFGGDMDQAIKYYDQV